MRLATVLHVTSTNPVTAPVISAQSLVASRITGIDLARAVAMLGMVIAHYAWPDGSQGALDELATAVKGRAMPLFVMLGGLGVTILASRSASPDRTLIIRAAMLYPLGLALQELTTFIAIILQSYALFFAVAPLLRRLPTRTLLAAAAVVAVAGSWTYQVVGPELDSFEGPSDLLTNPSSALWSLFFNGNYPFFPVAAFFMVGMALGRLDLRSTAVAKALAGAGTVIGIGTVVVSNRLIDLLDVDRNTFGAGTSGDSDGSFVAGRLLDTTGHSEMLAWVVSALGTSAAVLGLSLLLTPLLTPIDRPAVALGQLALSFYVFQAVLVRYTPHPNGTGLGQEFAIVFAIYFGFMVFAVLWRMRFRTGPLEAVLRLGSSRR